MNDPTGQARFKFRIRRALFFCTTMLLVGSGIRAMDMAAKFFLDTSTQYYVLPPGNKALGTNALGLRNPEIGPKDATRILFLGDSFTQGLGVKEEEGFVRRSEKILRQRFKVEHVNAGMTGFSPGNELGLYRAIRDRVRPDIVVVCLYQNDVYESGESLLLRRMKHNQQKKLGIRLLYWVAPNTSDFIYRTLLQKRYHDLLTSQALTLDRTEALLAASDAPERNPAPTPPPTVNPALFLIQGEVRKYAEELGVEESVTNAWLARNGAALVDGRNPQEVLLGLLEPDYFAQVYALEPHARPKFEAMLKAVFKIKEEAEANGSKFALIYIPSDIRYDRSKFDLMRNYGYVMDERWLEGRTEFGLELQRRTVTEKIPYMTLLDAFRKSNVGLTFPLDQHLNRRGHEVAAEAVAAFLEEHFASDLKK